MSIITLITDFGSGNYATGQMEGVIASIAPEANLVTLTHEIPAQDVLAAQVVLENAAPYFPEGTIHLVVIDPGTQDEPSGKLPRPIAARIGAQGFVGPDNGLITPLLQHAEANGWTVEVVETDRKQYWLPHSSQTFRGRDVFAPAAAFLARGVPLREMGELINDPVRRRLPEPEALNNGWRGQVIQMDHFGNLAVNLKNFHLEGLGRVRVVVGNAVIEGLARTFGDGKPGDLIALIDSSNRLSICVVNGSAARQLKVQAGDPVEVAGITEGS